VRQVESSKNKEEEALSDLDQAFTEHLWFAKNKGLVRLEQRREGKTAMVWKLTQFFEGTK
jgi:ligand-binding sensor domain-containing protein